jgi:hypothetical protein
LNQTERDEIARHAQALSALCGPTPADDADAEEATLVIVTKLMLVLPAAKQNEISAEARGEAYMAALDDLPTWAVASAVRRWYRGDCGKNERGESFDYHWCPAPAELRAIAQVEMWRVKSRAVDLGHLLRAECLIEYDDEHRGAMCDRIAALNHNFGIPPVGIDGSGGTVSAS